MVDTLAILGELRILELKANLKGGLPLPPQILP